MRWGAVASKPLPSSRPFVDRYRGETYALTDLGMHLAELTSDGAQFVDALSQRLIAAHPYLRFLLLGLEKNSIRCPEISEGDVERGRAGTHGWAAWAADQIGGNTSPDDIAKEIKAHLDRRFGNPPAGRPSNKALAETTNHALMVAAFAAHDVHLDATTIKTLLRWGSELLRLYDQSRYIPDHPDANVIWLAADLRRGPRGEILPARRGIDQYGEQVARAFPAHTRIRPAGPVPPWPSHTFLSTSYVPKSPYECAVTRAGTM